MISRLRHRAIVQRCVRINGIAAINTSPCPCKHLSDCPLAAELPDDSAKLPGDWVGADSVGGSANVNLAFLREVVRQGKLSEFQVQALFGQQRDELVLGNYLLSDKLGQDSLGALFVAETAEESLRFTLRMLPCTSRRQLYRIVRLIDDAAPALAHPNVAKNPLRNDHRADIFSLGATQAAPSPEVDPADEVPRYFTADEDFDLPE